MRAQVEGGCMKSSETVVFNVSLPGMSPPSPTFGNTSPLPKPTQKSRTASEQKTEDMLTKRKKLEQEAEKKRLEEEVAKRLCCGWVNDLKGLLGWTYVCLFFSIWEALGSMNISCLVLKLDNNHEKLCVFFFQTWRGMMSCKSIFDKQLDVKVCDRQTRNIWHPWLSQRHLQEPPFRRELPEKMYTLTLPKTNS